MWKPHKTREKFEVFWEIRAHSFYGYSMDDFCFKLILFLSYEDMKMCRYISFGKNAEDLTCNALLEMRSREETELRCTVF